MKNKKILILRFILAVCGVFAALYGIRMFNQYLLMKFPLGPRMVLAVFAQWLIFLVPGLLMLSRKEKLADIGFTKENIPRQVFVGAAVALVMSAVLTVAPILLGFKDMVGGAPYTKAWQFAYEFVYTVFGVALAEEAVFRGYLFHKLLEIKNSRWLAIAVTSVLFGLFHVFGGNWVQVLVTAAMGFAFCLMREKIKGCTLLSLIVAHGVYDALITLWAAVL